MKTILLGILAITVLAGCADPIEMNRATQQAFNDCTKKNWVPDYFSNGWKTNFSCKPVKPPIPMNEQASTAFTSCLDKGKNAIYDGPSASVICTEKGNEVKIRN